MLFMYMHPCCTWIITIYLKFLPAHWISTKFGMKVMLLETIQTLCVYDCLTSCKAIAVVMLGPLVPYTEIRWGQIVNHATLVTVIFFLQNVPYIPKCKTTLHIKWSPVTMFSCQESPCFCFNYIFVSLSLWIHDIPELNYHQSLNISVLIQ